MRGVINLFGTTNATIANCSFQSNEAGPIFENKQVVGLKDNDDDFGNVLRASTIFIGDGSSHVTIANSSFSNNTLDFMMNLTLTQNPEMVAFFPPDYFSKAFSPVITVYQTDLSVQASNISIMNSTFINQRSSQVLGYSMFNLSDIDLTFYCSLVCSKQLSSGYTLRLEGNSVHDFIFQGEHSSLIYNSNKGRIFASMNSFSNIGYLDDPSALRLLPYQVTAGSTKVFPFQSNLTYSNF